MKVIVSAVRWLLPMYLLWLLAYVAFALVPDERLQFVWVSLGFDLMFAAFAAAIVAWCLVSAVVCSFRRAWLVAVLCLGIAAALPIAAHFMFFDGNYPFEYLHFLVMRHQYDAEVSRLPNDGKRYAEFNWGGMLFASRGIVYDETDEVALPYGQQSAAWKIRMNDTDLTCGRDGPIGEVLPVGGHYYIAGFGC